jgi:sulfotransferase 6B1
MSDLKDSLKFQTKLARRSWRRLQKQMSAGGKSLGRSPRLFGNSFPKSGTHWLTQVMEGLPSVSAAVDSGLPAITTFVGESGRERATSEILNDLGRFLPGDTGYGHLHARPEIVDLLTRPDWCTYFILRDPRDIVVSHVFYVTDIEPNHVHHAYYTEVLKTFEERLRISILGRPELVDSFPDITGRFQPYLGWMNNPAVLGLRYEDAISQPQETIHAILTHAQKRGLVFTCTLDQAVDQLFASMDPTRSPTFRQGKSGGWRKHFTPEITDLFKKTAGQLLIDLGYEKDLDWE